MSDNTSGAFSGDDGRRSSQEGEIIATGVSPSNERESAIVATMRPSAGCTAVLSGAVGVALVEVYGLQ